MVLIWVCDFVVDWGFVDKGHEGLRFREELMLSPRKVYFTAMALDLIATPGHVLLLAPYQDVVKAWFVPFFVVVEILRRAQWAFFSLEYRMVSEAGATLLKPGSVSLRDSAALGADAVPRQLQAPEGGGVVHVLTSPESS